MRNRTSPVVQRPRPSARAGFGLITVLVARDGFTLALVAAEPPRLIDPAAPQFLKVAALSWLPETSRLAYSADREFWSESRPTAGLRSTSETAFAGDRTSW